VSSHISLRKVTKTYKGAVDLLAVRETDLEIEKNSIVALLGPSGSGKTTLLHLIGGLTKATTGTVEVNGENLSDIDGDALSRFRRCQIGFIFQFFNLIDSLTVEENIRMGADEVSAQQVDQLLEGVQLEDKRRSFPSTLSGGQQQRIAVARALAGNPNLLLCDEPTGSLDQDSGRQVLTMLQNESIQNNRTVLLVTHNQAVAQTANRIITLKDGAISSDIQNEPKKASALQW
jgi:putative ABC transport system ATP-binding protein